jgi:hypothetical protein
MKSLMMTMDTQTNDWRYTPERMKLREECLNILMLKYGSVRVDQVSYSTQDIYECADEWISQGNQISHGIVAYFNAYFINGRK